MSKRDARRNMGLQAAEDANTYTGLTLEQSVIEGYGLRGIERVDKRNLAIGENGFTYGRFTLTQTQLVIPEDTNPDEWSEIGHVLLRMQGAIQWLLGDWLAFGESRQWGETYQAVAAEYDYEVETLWTYASVARSVNSLIRNQGLSFSHHRLVAKMSQVEQQHWLDLAAANHWSITQMRDAISEKSPQPLPLSQPSDLFSPDIPRNFRKMFILGMKAGQGDKKAREKALGFIKEYRKWLDAVETWLEETE